MIMALVCIVFSMLYSTIFIGQTLSADCGTTAIGYGTSTFSETPSNEAVATILTSEDGYYRFECCGVVKKWSFVVKTAATVKFQVWRFSTTYTVVGENTFTVPSGAENKVIEFEVPESERITVKQNDVFGWQGDYIAYRDGSGHYPKGFRIRNQVFNVGDTFNFQGLGIGNKINNRAYAITATTANSATPYFYNLPQTIHVYDHIATGTSVFALTAKDDDSDYDGISLTLPTPSSYFTLSTAELQTSASISSLTGTTQSLSVKVEDSCGKSTTSTLTIIVRNQIPVIISLPTTYEIQETHTSSSLIHTLGVTDGEAVTCTISSTSPAGGPFTATEITTGSGNYGIYTNANPMFDFDTTKRYDVFVRCSDGKDNDVEQLVVIVKKNAVPDFTNLPKHVEKDQQTTSNNVVLDTVSVTDTDGLTFTYTCDPASCPISIASNGKITSTSAFPTVFTPGYDVTIAANDGHTTVGGKLWSIHVKGINDKPQFSNVHGSLGVFGVEENSPVGTTLYVVSATDIDAGDTLSFSWTSSPTLGVSFFNLESSTGVIKTKASLDYETMASKSFTFTISVTDSKDTAVATVTITVLDVNEAPSFHQTSYSVTGDEDVAGTKLSAPGLTVSDPDAGDTKFYTLDCNGYNTGFFEMDSSNGDVYLGRDFDRDAGHPETTLCNVTVRDKGGLTDVSSLTITIDDVNDNTPTFESPVFTFYLDPLDPVGTRVGDVTLSATDNDVSASFSSVTYSVDMSAFGNDYFAVDGEGNITVNNDLSSKFSRLEIIDFKLIARDSGGLSATSTVSIIFPGTTTTTTTTTERPKEFWEDPLTVVWLEFAFALLAALCVFIVILSIRHCPMGSKADQSKGNNASLKDTKDKDRLMKKQPKSKLRSINHLLGAFASGNKSTDKKSESKDTEHGKI